MRSLYTFCDRLILRIVGAIPPMGRSDLYRGKPRDSGSKSQSKGEVILPFSYVISDFNRLNVPRSPLYPGYPTIANLCLYVAGMHQEICPNGSRDITHLGSLLANTGPVSQRVESLERVFHGFKIPPRQMVSKELYGYAAQGSSFSIRLGVDIDQPVGISLDSIGVTHQKSETVSLSRGTSLTSPIPLLPTSTYSNTSR